jgi:hypothetical protein
MAAIAGGLAPPDPFDPALYAGVRRPLLEAELAADVAPRKRGDGRTMSGSIEIFGYNDLITHL